MYGKNLKLVLMAMLLLVGKTTFSQVTERERPKEWSQLVKGARFMDRFLPMKGNQLSSDTWGTSDVRPRYVDNVMVLKTVSGPIGVEISGKEKTVNII